MDIGFCGKVSNWFAGPERQAQVGLPGHLVWRFRKRSSWFAGPERQVQVGLPGHPVSRIGDQGFTLL